ncbi:AraC family transcriptional regulator [Chryseobacterium phosphatilyticum]|uniref:AraC family transcriptional regulator n=1 Tax=Chryseobacterium phosphatilyticum TaxID=475075 RepID=A0A316XBD5_9FLAO|nr:AraC family transcriptional regulator [Chryseobacterium phosphatilyticum]PWN71135.1 AraC family transcriptional regulator [Chryseobacterium phosphatilyticum]
MDTHDSTVPLVLRKLADSLGTEIKDRKLEIPARFGSGYCTGFIFNEYIRMLISNYELNDNINIENKDFNPSRRMLFFKFQNVFPKDKTSSEGKNRSDLPSVLIGTSRINTDGVIAIHSNTATINIEIDAEYLSGMFLSSHQSPVLQGLLKNAQPFLFEQMIHPALQHVVDEIISDHTEDVFKLYFLRLKAEELICRLLIELEKRDEQQVYALNLQDIKTIYQIKEKILRQLENPPVIKDLAIESGMSPTKLKRLFKQIFGNSIFSYYQEFRMKEAAFLLKDKRYTVSEVGYMLGFTNLSHFSKVFREHLGMKPKQYSMLY